MNESVNGEQKAQKMFFVVDFSTYCVENLKKSWDVIFSLIIHFTTPFNN